MPICKKTADRFFAGQRYGCKTKVVKSSSGMDVDVRILEAIERHGSINAAAKELKMGYRAVWARISATENRLGKKLLVRQTGGSAGGGSQLTPLAQELVKNFKKVQMSVETMTDELFSNLMGEALDIKK